MKQYDHKKIEKKWQEAWRGSGLYISKEDSNKPKCYVLDMFPYPSGEGLHVGHPKGYIATDIYSRYKKMSGFEILHPMGWDAFGLPAENYAIKNKIHPRVAVEKNIENFKSQLSHIGFNYDWTREINTTDPEFYKWTQWMFIRMYKAGLAFQTNEPINWCPSCMTGLANEDIEQGVCERCGTPVEKKKLPQWALRITDYADRMLKDLDLLQWPEHIKEAQRNWIGKSEGAEIDFNLLFKKNPADNDNRGPNGERAHLTVFTTRPDTLFGATYLAISPEHLWVTLALDERHDVLENKDEVKAYVAQAAQKTEIERMDAGKEKTGVELKGVVAINLVNNEEIPIYVADYVIGGYGTGAIMAVPAHDERDNAFATKYSLPIKPVIEPTYEQTTEPGKIREGEPFDHREAIIAIVKHWSEDKYIALRWKEVAWGTFITGGIEEGQTPEDAGRMELREETGYTNARFIAEFGVVHGKFYHVPKKTNRNAHAHVVYFELEDDTRTVVADEENAKHEILWLDKEELAKFLTPDTHHHALRWLSGESPIFTMHGTLANSGEFDQLESAEAMHKIVEKVGGRMKSTYRLKDWIFSRQRYWGEPIPMIHCAKCGTVPVPESQLPVLLPEVESYEPSGTGESPLAAIKDWVNVQCPECDGPAKRETNTMPQWAGSSWYYLRFMDPHNSEAFAGKEAEKHWAPVDVYVGGDHAVRHLIYARFWHKFLYDIGAVTTLEPFARLEFLGFILAEDGRKMSKRYGNVINPDDVVSNYGADSFRVYEMFMGPFTDTIAWNTNNMIGARRFIERVWRLKETIMQEGSAEIERLLHKTIKKVGEDIESFKFNTAVSQMMIFLNAAEKSAPSKVQFEMFLKLLAPFAPHMSEELWNELGNESSIHLEYWPIFDPGAIKEDILKIAVQVDGKSRAMIEVPADASNEIIEQYAREEVLKHFEGREVARTVLVPSRLINFVLK